jgi:hypothetical protein
LTGRQKTSKIPSMKTTFDLPPDLVRAVKLRAVHEGRKLKDVAADLLKRGLAGPESPAKPQPAKPKIEIQANGLPVVRCIADAPAKRMSAVELLALEQETLHQEDLQRLGHAL